MSPVRILLSASFPRPRVSSVSSVAATSHCRHGFFSDAVQAASSLVRSFPVHVPSTYSRCPLSLFSIFSRSPLSLLTLFLCSNVLPRLTRRALASSPHIVASPSHASLIACLHYFSRSPCTYPQVSCKNRCRYSRKRATFCRNSKRSKRAVSGTVLVSGDSERSPDPAQAPGPGLS